MAERLVILQQQTTPILDQETTPILDGNKYPAYGHGTHGGRADSSGGPDGQNHAAARFRRRWHLDRFADCGRRSITLLIITPT